MESTTTILSHHSLDMIFINFSSTHTLLKGSRRPDPLGKAKPIPAGKKFSFRVTIEQFSCFLVLDTRSVLSEMNAYFPEFKDSKRKSLSDDR